MAAFWVQLAYQLEVLSGPDFYLFDELFVARTRKDQPHFMHAGREAVFGDRDDADLLVVDPYFRPGVAAHRDKARFADCLVLLRRSRVALGSCRLQLRLLLDCCCSS